MESSANGMTFFGNIVSFILGVMFIVIVLSGSEVSLVLPLMLLSQYFKAQGVKTGELTVGFYLGIAILPASTCSWVLWNREAQAFLRKKIVCFKTNNIVAPMAQHSGLSED